MPTNLPPDYFKIEEEFRTATTGQEKIACLEEMLRIIPKHKGTDRLRGNLRRKLSKLKESAEARKGTSRQISPYHIDPEGSGQIVVIGPANVGKSALVSLVTNASPEVAAYPFTTWVPTPGMMPIENIQVQLIDTPPLDRDFVEPEMLNLFRRGDLLLLMIDLQAYPIEQLEETVAMLEENRIVPLHRLDRFEGQRRVTPVNLIVAVNKVDGEAEDEDFEVLCELLEEEWSLIPISVSQQRNLDELKWTLFDQLDIMRVYSKPPGKEPDLTAPFVLSRGGTVEDFAGKVHKDFLESLKSARIWGKGVYDGQLVSRDHVLHDGDVVELRV
jgi:ribosome-interacting GTPase 1